MPVGLDEVRLHPLAVEILLGQHPEVVASDLADEVCRRARATGPHSNVGGAAAEASGLLNDLYNDVDVDERRLARLLCLFRLDFTDPKDMRPAIAGRPVYLAMAMNESNALKLKPQNLLLNLPLARPQ